MVCLSQALKYMQIIITIKKNSNNFFVNIDMNDHTLVTGIIVFVVVVGMGYGTYFLYTWWKEHQHHKKTKIPKSHEKFRQNMTVQEEYNQYIPTPYGTTLQASNGTNYYVYWNWVPVCHNTNPTPQAYNGPPLFDNTNTFSPTNAETFLTMNENTGQAAAITYTTEQGYYVQYSCDCAPLTAWEFSASSTALTFVRIPQYSTQVSTASCFSSPYSNIINMNLASGGIGTPSFSSECGSFFYDYLTNGVYDVSSLNASCIGLVQSIANNSPTIKHDWLYNPVYSANQPVPGWLMQATGQPGNNTPELMANTLADILQYSDNTSSSPWGEDAWLNIGGTVLQQVFAALATVFLFGL
jgi:hypothetical protein